jgi:prepilin-type processing-associated H-X9-DG protein
VTDQIAQQSGFATGATGGFVCDIGVPTELYDVKESTLEDPVWTVVCADAPQFGCKLMGPSSIAFEVCGTMCGNADWENCPQSVDCGLDADLYERFSTDPSFRAKYTRHLGGSNLGFADGHAAWMPAEQLMNEAPHCDPSIDPDYGIVNPDGRIEGLCNKY